MLGEIKTALRQAQTSTWPAFDAVLKQALQTTTPQMPKPGLPIMVIPYTDRQFAFNMNVAANARGLPIGLAASIMLAAGLEH